MRILFVSLAPDVPGDHGLSHVLKGNNVELLTGAVDRAGLERALRAEQYDALHFVGHGTKGVLGLTDGDIDAADLTTMVETQRRLKFVFVNACNSLSLATELHNTLHVPVIAHDAPVLTTAAVRFSETFYRSYASNPEVKEAFQKGRQTLLLMAREFPEQAVIPQLINGDMATEREMSDCMLFVKTELGAVRADIQHLSNEIQTMKTTRPNGMTWALAALLLLLLMAQIATALVNATHFP